MAVEHERHIRLLAGLNAGGAPVHEEVPARLGAEGLWELMGTPALATGCAAGDVIRVAPGGQFVVVQHGGNVGVVSYARPGQDLQSAAEALRHSTASSGLVEVDPAGRWIVATLPVSLGWPRIENLLMAWSSATGAEWSYLNVYDDQDRPLNWWL